MNACVTLTAVCLLAGGVSAAEFSTAKCVWAEGRQAESNLTVSFRAPFEWKGGAAPVCRIAAATVYRAFLNGEFVSWGPARTVGGFACVDEFKLAPKPGRNVLTIEVAGYNVASYQYSGDKSFLCAEVVQDGTPLVATPSDFEAVEAPRAKTGPVYSRQRGFVAEGYEIDRDWVRWSAGEESARPRLKLAVVPSPKWRTRASARPAFRMNTSFAAEKEHWTLPSVDSGFVGLRFRCLRPGKISVEFDEALGKDGRIDLGRNGDPLSSWHAMLNRITWDVKEPGEYCVETMEPYTMRYVRAVTDGGAFEDVRPTLRQCRNSGMEKAAFDSSDPELNRLFAAAKESVAQNAVDIFTDCPSRERVGWLCDTYFTANAAAWLSGDFAIEREYLLNFTLTDDFGPNIPKGAIPGFMPSRSGGLMPTYAMWYVVQCVQAASRLESSARQVFTDRVRGRIEGILGYLAGFEREGLLEDLPGWVFIEWSKANDYVKGVNFPANMMWAFALDCAGALFGRADLHEKAAAVRVRTLELSMKDGRFHDQALRGADGRLALNDAASTEVCQYYAFFTDLVSPASHPQLWRTLVDEVGPGRRGHPEMDVADAFVGWMLRCELLARYGESKELYRSIKSYYGRMAETSGTLWEFADGHDSRCHAFAGNIAALIFREAFGIERIDWANKTVSWREPSTELASACGRIPVPVGEISVRITCENGRPIRKFSLPDGWR